MVHIQFSEIYIHFSFMYNTDNIFPVLPIKHLINHYSEQTMPHKLEIGTKPSVSNLRVSLWPCVVRKATENVDTKALNMHHQSQKVFCGIFIAITQHHKGYLNYVPSTQKIVSSRDLVFDETFSSALVYTPRPYLEALTMRP